MGLRVSIDVGGTFTDFVYIDDKGNLGSFKMLTNPRNPGETIVSGLMKIGGEIEEVVHATTIATNALRGQISLELPRAALIATKGFRDVIEIGRQNRPRLYDQFFEKPRPLIPRELRFEVRERTSARGEIIERVDPVEIREVYERLRRSGVISVAISFLHSYINPSNERIAKEIAREYFRYAVASHEVAPEPREYERTSTAVVNAVLMPLVSRYIESLASSLSRFGDPKLYIMSSSGGLIDTEEAVKKPVQIIESGPAAGVVAASELAKIIGEKKVISLDIGGTTAKAGTILNGEIEITSEYEVGGEAHYGRIIKGSGYPVRFPFIDLAEVSAGGGTIIWRDEAGALRVGPISSGADPGPICYGRGGKEPTITDANLVLGRIGEYLLGGNMKLDRKGALRGLTKLGDPYEVASEAVRLADLEAARAIRLVTIERGLDPSEFALVAFGGAGPQHAVAIAEELGIRRVMIPPFPGVFSALGLLLADWRFEARASFPGALEEAYRSLEESILRRVGRADYFVRYADVRYRGQGWEITIPAGRPASFEEVSKSFEERHTSLYGFKMDLPVEIVTIRVFAVIRRDKPTLPSPKKHGDPSPRGYRRVYIADSWVDAPTYAREDLSERARVRGPALIDEYDSTTVIPHCWEAFVGGAGSLIIEKL
ncbi:MAG: hydantoinase/oxoprolinase family protein [Desulfurococcales archaeon]|jgi:N-methylhydantoinase A|nr:hydantoinase/oxoprolinase family protein [Desulfurococcales archaeon]